MGNATSTDADALQDLAQQQKLEPQPAYEKELEIALSSVQVASKVAQGVFQKLVTEEVVNKSDASPVTVADYSVQAVIIHYLKKAFPEDKVVAEESAKDLKTPEQLLLKQRVVELTNSALEAPGLTEDEVLTAIEHGVHGIESTGRFWVIDPIDGTKGFLRGGQYAVCLALVVDTQVVVGVLGCPNLPLNNATPETLGCILSAVRGHGATIRSITGENPTPIHVNDIADPKQAVVTESVEAAHTAHSDAQEIVNVLGIATSPIRMDSQAKYASVARGDSAIYLRLPTSASYQENIWDHAAGYLIVREAGGEVTDVHGEALDFSEGRKLIRNQGVIATNKKLHARVLGAVEWVLFPPVQKFKVTVKREAPSLETIQNSIATSCNIDKSLITVEAIVEPETKQVTETKETTQ